MMENRNFLEKIGSIGPLFVAIAAMLWATDYWARPKLSKAFGPTIANAITLVFFEHILALTFLIIFLIFLYKGLFPSNEKLDFNKLRNLSPLEAYSGIHIGLASALGNIFFTMAIIYGFQNSIAGGFDQLLFVQKIQPVFAILLAYYLLKERFSWKFYIILLPIILFGLFLINFGQGSFKLDFSTISFSIDNLWSITSTNSGLIFTLLGISLSIGNLWHINLSSPSLIITLLGLAAAFCWGTATVFGRVLVQKVDYPMTTLIRYTVATVFLIILDIIILPDFLTSINNATTALPLVMLGLLLIFLALLPGVIPLFIYYFGLKNSKASYATIAELAYPLTAVIINEVFNNQYMEPMQWLGGLVIIIAITWFSLDTMKANKQKELLIEKGFSSQDTPAPFEAL